MQGETCSSPPTAAADASPLSPGGATPAVAATRRYQKEPTVADVLTRCRHAAAAAAYWRAFRRAGTIAGIMLGPFVRVFEWLAARTPRWLAFLGLVAEAAVLWLVFQQDWLALAAWTAAWLLWVVDR